MPARRQQHAVVRKSTINKIPQHGATNTTRLLPEHQRHQTTRRPPPTAGRVSNLTNGQTEEQQIEANQTTIPAKHHESRRAGTKHHTTIRQAVLSPPRISLVQPLVTDAVKNGENVKTQEDNQGNQDNIQVAGTLPKLPPSPVPRASAALLPTAHQEKQPSYDLRNSEHSQARSEIPIATPARRVNTPAKQLTQQVILPTTPSLNRKSTITATPTLNAQPVPKLPPPPVPRLSPSMLMPPAIEEKEKEKEKEQEPTEPPRKQRKLESLTRRTEKGRHQTTRRAVPQTPPSLPPSNYVAGFNQNLLVQARKDYPQIALLEKILVEAADSFQTSNESPQAALVASLFKVSKSHYIFLSLKASFVHLAAIDRRTSYCHRSY